MAIARRFRHLREQIARTHLMSELCLTRFSVSLLLPCIPSPTSPSHCGPEQPKTQTEVLGHTLVRLLVRSHRSLVRLLRTTCFAHALCCAHSFARSLTLLTPSLVGE